MKDLIENIDLIDIAILIAIGLVIKLLVLVCMYIASIVKYRRLKKLSLQQKEMLKKIRQENKALSLLSDMCEILKEENQQKTGEMSKQGIRSIDIILNDVLTNDEKLLLLHKMFPGNEKQIPAYILYVGFFLVRYRL